MEEFDNAYTDEMDFGRFSLRSIVLFVDRGCLIIHILFIAAFMYLRVWQMVGFNLLSVTLYALLGRLIRTKEKYTPIVSAGLLEIVAHAVAATVYVGWNCGFSMYIICIAPIPFFLRLKKEFMVYLMSFATVGIFFWLRIYSSNRSHIAYAQPENLFTAILYIFNSLMGAFILIGFAAYFRHNRETNHRRLTEQNDELKRLAAIDPLTQLFNRRAMMGFLKAVQERSERTGKKYVIVMSDIDDFKVVNDTYGHDAGDLILRAVSELAAETVPAEGYVCRWGGEELLFVIPQANCRRGIQIAETIRSRIEGREFTVNGMTFKVTITFGVCESQRDISYEKIISVADKCLYYGKQNGKNRVVSIDQLP